MDLYFPGLQNTLMNMNLMKTQKPTMISLILAFLMKKLRMTTGRILRMILMLLIFVGSETMANPWIPSISKHIKSPISFCYILTKDYCKFVMNRVRYVFLGEENFGIEGFSTSEKKSVHQVKKTNEQNT